MPPGYQAIIGMLAGGFAGVTLGELASRYPEITATPETAAQIRTRSRALGWAIRALPILATLAFLGGGLFSVRFLRILNAYPGVSIFLMFTSLFLYPDLVRGAFELLFAISPEPPWNRLVPRRFLTSDPELRYRGALRLAICLVALGAMRALGLAIESTS